MWLKEFQIQEIQELDLELGYYKRKIYSLLTFLVPQDILLQRSVWDLEDTFGIFLALELIRTVALLATINHLCFGSQISLLLVSAGYINNILRFLNSKF